MVVGSDIDLRGLRFGRVGAEGEVVEEGGGCEELISRFAVTLEGDTSELWWTGATAWCF